MSDFQIVQQPVAQFHLLQGGLDAMKLNGGLSKTANPRLRCTSSRLLVRKLEVEIKKPMEFFRNE